MGVCTFRAVSPANACRHATSPLERLQFAPCVWQAGKEPQQGGDKSSSQSGIAGAAASSTAREEVGDPRGASEHPASRGVKA